eukprot:TRINITY_DN1865_c0_g1_i1.p1 TRINITY_DN1865_c0_g1~~TRINITY_DN1865_c0_g1_i1.p1  ORF type:complete len:659 (-),score=192.68 TRINITY_DN1865_c0_g1_i1:65-2041(-)
MSSVSKLSAVYGGSKSPSPSSSPSPSPASKQTSPSSTAASSSSEANGNVRVYIAGANTPSIEFQSPVSLGQILAGLGWASTSSGALCVRGKNDVYVSQEKITSGDYDLHRTEAMKFKVVLNKKQLVVPYAFPCLQVKSLMDDICFRFAKYYTGSLQISELRTSDGYLINKFDTIRDVLSDGDYIHAVDYNTWISEVEKTCNEEWLDVSQEDFIEEDKKKWISIGRTTNNQLYLQVGVARDTKKLEVYDLEELRDYSKEGTTPIITFKGGEANAQYHMIVSFVIKQGVVVAVICDVKSCSDLRSRIVQQDFEVGDGGKLEKKTVTTVQTSEDPYDASSCPPPSLPSPVHTGPSVDHLLGDKETQVQAELKKTCIFDHMRVEQNEKIDADQQWARDGGFMNQLMVNLLLINSSPDKELHILRIRTQYKINGEWKEAEQTALGSKRGYYNYSWNWEESSLDLAPTSQSKISVLAGFKIHAYQADKQRRLHHSIPSPLSLRIIFEDYSGKEGIFDVEYVNPPLDTYTEKYAETRLDPKGSKYDKFVYADDLEAECRQYIAIRKKSENGKERLEVYMSNNSSYYYLYPNQLKASVFEAIKTNSNEVEIESLKQSSNNDNLTRRVIAIVNQQQRRVVALKLQIQTTTSFTENYFIVPHLATSDN